MQTIKLKRRDFLARVAYAPKYYRLNKQLPFSRNIALLLTIRFVVGYRRKEYGYTTPPQTVEEYNRAAHQEPVTMYPPVTK